VVEVVDVKVMLLEIMVVLVVVPVEVPLVGLEILHQLHHHKEIMVVLELPEEVVMEVVVVVLAERVVQDRFFQEPVVVRDRQYL
jgi:hypothetical protein